MFLYLDLGQSHGVALTVNLPVVATLLTCEDLLDSRGVLEGDNKSLTFVMYRSFDHKDAKQLAEVDS